MPGKMVNNDCQLRPYFKPAASGSKLVIDFQSIDSTSSRCLNCGAFILHGADAVFARSQHRNNPKRGNCCTHPDSKAAMRKQEKRDLREQRKKDEDEEMVDSAGDVGEVTQDDGVYAGQVRKSVPHGSGIKKFVDGSSYTGEWHEGKRDGYGVHLWTETSQCPLLGTMITKQMQYEGTYSADERNGSCVQTETDSDGWTKVLCGSYTEGKQRESSYCSETRSKGSGSKTVQRGCYLYGYSYDGMYDDAYGFIEKGCSDQKVEAATQAADESAQKARACAQKAKCVAKAAAKAAVSQDALRLKQTQEVALKEIASLQLGENVEVQCNIACSDGPDELEEIIWVSSFVSMIRLIEGEVNFDVTVTEWAHLDQKDDDYAAPYIIGSYGLHGDTRWRRGIGMASAADLLAKVVCDGPYNPDGFGCGRP